MPPTNKAKPHSEYKYWKERLESAQAELIRLQELVEQGQRRPSNPHLIETWKKSIVHWKQVESEARTRLARLAAPADENNAKPPPRSSNQSGGASQRAHPRPDTRRRS